MLCQTIGGVYRVDAFVGSGAMAHVFRVTELASGKTMAMKVMAPQTRNDEDLRRRFRRELRENPFVEGEERHFDPCCAFAEA